MFITPESKTAFIAAVVITATNALMAAMFLPFLWIDSAGSLPSHTFFSGSSIALASLASIGLGLVASIDCPNPSTSRVAVGVSFAFFLIATLAWGISVVVGEGFQLGNPYMYPPATASVVLGIAVGWMLLDEHRQRRKWRA